MIKKHAIVNSLFVCCFVFLTKYTHYLHLDMTKCKSYPCLNGGVCQAKPDGYTCACTSNFKGVHCETGNTI